MDAVGITAQDAPARSDPIEARRRLATTAGARQERILASRCKRRLVQVQRRARKAAARCGQRHQDGIGDAAACCQRPCVEEPSGARGLKVGGRGVLSPARVGPVARTGEPRRDQVSSFSVGRTKDACDPGAGGGQERPDRRDPNDVSLVAWVRCSGHLARRGWKGAGRTAAGMQWPGTFQAGRRRYGTLAGEASPVGPGTHPEGQW